MRVREKVCERERVREKEREKERERRVGNEHCDHNKVNQILVHV